MRLGTRRPVKPFATTEMLEVASRACVSGAAAASPSRSTANGSAARYAALLLRRAGAGTPAANAPQCHELAPSPRVNRHRAGVATAVAAGRRRGAATHSDERLVRTVRRGARVLGGGAQLRRGAARHR